MPSAIAAARAMTRRVQAEVGIAYSLIRRQAVSMKAWALRGLRSGRPPKIITSPFTSSSLSASSRLLVASQRWSRTASRSAYRVALPNFQFGTL
jgi:hypothetical protein